eukprot:CAMPEP_0114131756 /NCGR_PEP_ID=MMETSP0043_2-20121206/12725_1 /TAXON_ID=464988 /ORGANISM="Hemiselmis andersenii, Strain CCMP644" /LENGTH=312 /DNA_ID=CAMNT_0001225213 /DNA_START=316 /DNA_END=1254 /DNA_ORIENTATION=+
MSLEKIRNNTRVPGWASDKSSVKLLGSNLTTIQHKFSCLSRRVGSQQGEDDFAYNTFFYGKANGIFLETGALDGMLYSNSLYFDRRLGWKGLLIEASPHSYESLVVNRPNQVNIHAALCAESKTVHWADKSAVDSLVTWRKKKHMGAVNGIIEFMSPEFKRRWWQSTPGGAEMTGIPVQCVPLAAILELYGFKLINYFSLDVEGGELEVLRSINFSSVLFDVVSIEMDGSNKEKDEEVNMFMFKHGFKLHTTGFNSWFVREGFRPSSNPECAESYTIGQNCFTCPHNRARIETGNLQTTRSGNISSSPKTSK